MMKSERLKMERVDTVLYCEACMEDEFTVADMESICNKITEEFAGPADVVLKKTGSYSVSVGAQVALSRGVDELNNFIYVADEKRKIDSAEYAAKTYMKRYNTRVVCSNVEAFALLGVKAST